MIGVRRLLPSLIILTLLATDAAQADVGEVVATAAEVGITPESLVVADLHPAALVFLQRLDAASDLRTALAVRHAEADAAAACTPRRNVGTNGL